LRIEPFARLRVALGGQEIELQDLEHEGGGMHLLRIRIREGKRFTIFDVDPGGNVSPNAIARNGRNPFTSGLLYFVHAETWGLRSSAVSGAGSNVGLEYIASTAPVLTFSATTDPRLPARPCCAACCAALLNVRTTVPT